MPTSLRKFDQLDNHTPIAIQDVPKGGSFQRKPDANKIYTAQGYCRYNKKYQGDDWDDISRDIYFKKGTIVYTVDH